MGKKKRKRPPSKYRKQRIEPRLVPEGQPRPSETPLATSRSDETQPSDLITLLPMAPLICRSGRPFDEQAGPDSARFPPPSTVAGCVRTARARQTGSSFGPELMGLSVAGPLLARPAADGSLCLYAPRPADASYFGQGDNARCLRAEPGEFADGCGADLPDDLLLVQLTESLEGKETKGPAWWAWEDLLAFRDGEDLAHARLCEGGWSPSQGDLRTHVAIERGTQAARTGALFQTEGLDLSSPEGLAGDPASDFRLLVKTGEPLSATMAQLGGERRLARIELRADSAWPKMPADWVDRIREKKGIVLTLLTPALFSAGYRPGWLSPAGRDPNPARLLGSPPGVPGLKLALRAAALDRWQPHSGWDLATQQPRAGRKLVPAGAVYWLAIEGEPSDADLQAIWLTSICDQGQDRRDGFGLAMPAPWLPPEYDTESNTSE